MKKLLKVYGMQSDMQYFEMIAQSFVVGQIDQAKNQFKQMSKEYRKLFIKSAIGNWNSGIQTKNLLLLIDLI